MTLNHRALTEQARAEGEAQMQLAFDAAQRRDDTFGQRAYEFIVRYVREESRQTGSVPGELVTMAAQAAGIGAGRDGRAFGAIYSKAIRNGDIRVVGYCKRIKGHGTSGGRLYASSQGE